MTADLATHLAATTPYSRAEWLPALARLPADVDDETTAEALEDLAAGGIEPLTLVRELFVGGVE